MLKKICILAVISVFAVAAMACSRDEVVEDGKPNLNLSYQQDGKEVTIVAALGGHSYTIDNGNGTKTSVIADSSHILQWTKELMPVVVMDNNSQTLKIRFQFNKEATNCKVIAWEEKYFGNDAGVQESDGKDISVQSEKEGDTYFVEVSPGYVYEVKAEGEDWRSDFGFHVTTDTQTSQEEEFQSKSFSEIQKILSTYPDSLDKLSKYKEIFLIVHGNIEQGKELWDTFYQKVQDKTPSELIMAQFTTEGDPILYYLSYDGEIIQLVKDVSRDAFKGDYEDYHEFTYSYLKVLEDSQEDEKGQYIMLVNDDSLTMEDIRNLWNSEEETINECLTLTYINMK